MDVARLVAAHTAHLAWLAIPRAMSRADADVVLAAMEAPFAATLVPMVADLVVSLTALSVDGATRLPTADDAALLAAFQNTVTFELTQRFVVAAAVPMPAPVWSTTAAALQTELTARRGVVLNNSIQVAFLDALAPVRAITP
jgi:hypothetical protein